MEGNELLRRAEDLLRRCRRSACVTSTCFLTPAQRVQLESWARQEPDCRLIFHGGRPECERTAGFFLPYDGEEEELDPAEYLRAMELTACFGSPGHRDYMGALLAMGVKREWIGDIWVRENQAWVFCMPSVLGCLVGIDKVGRYTVRAREIPLKEVPAPLRKTESLHFTVMSMRLDAVAAGMFRLSRSEAARQIAAGNLSLNYLPCLKADAPVKEGDILSLRHMGKGTVTGTGGSSRKGRLFVYAEIYK